MGGALLGGWLAHGVAPAQVRVVEPGASAAEAARTSHGVAVVSDPGGLDAAFAPGVVVLAVKPQAMDAALAAHRRFVAPDTVFLSIAAGKSIGYFTRHLGEGAAIVRAMPNMPAAVGRGISVLCANPAATAEQREACRALLAAVGEAVWVDDESLLDAVTAVSGSGPAYVFLLIEYLAEAGADAGLPAELAMQLARATVCGAGALAVASPEPAGALRRSVASPGGTTEAALEVLMGEDGLEPLLGRAVAAAARRSRELAD